MCKRKSGFTLTELMIVMGLIAMLVALLFPALGKVRAASNAAACLSNLRQLGAALTMYCAEARGRLPEYIWSTPATPELSYNAYWTGIAEKHHVREKSLFCPAATTPTGQGINRGYGTATAAWTGKFGPGGTAVRFNAQIFREGSYGYNRYLTAGGGFGCDGKATRLNGVNEMSNVPAFMDCAYVDAKPPPGTEIMQPPPPPNLRGDRITPGTPEHWKFLLARHARGINVCMADGSARWIAAEDMYLLNWKAAWVKFRLNLPKL